MRAAVITEHGAAPAPAEHPDPARSAGQALVAVTAAPIVPLDVLCATGASYFGAQPLPYVPGVQGVGRVVESESAPVGYRVGLPTPAGLGPGVGKQGHGPAAVGGGPRGVPDDADGADDALVAALGLSAVAAWMVLTWRAGLHEGEQVLVLGAGGVVGQVAVQAARRLGARRVVAACRSGVAQARAADCGADAVVPLHDDDRPETLQARLAEASDGPFDVVVDPLFGVPATAAAALLGSGGRLVNLGSSAGATAVLGSAHLRSHTASILGYTNNDITVEQRRDALLAVLGHGFDVAHDVVPFERVGAAWSDQAEGRAVRRQVLRVAGHVES